MRRQDKYPDTKYFHFYNANPKNKFTEDCTVRALTVALDIPYKQALMELVESSLKTGYSVSSIENIGKVLAYHGWKKMKQPRKKDNTKYTGEEFCKVQQQWLFTDDHFEWEFVNNVVINNIVISPRLFCNIGGGHVAAIIDGKVWDTWNSTGGCIGNYWVKG